jgi:DNA-binding NtrC family response regulator
MEEGDALLLARSFLADLCRRYGVPQPSLSAEAEAAISAYPWPGNVRELANAMERVVLFAEADPVPTSSLGLPTVTTATSKVTVAGPGDIRIEFPDSGVSLEAVERALIVQALDRVGGNQSAAARLLGLSRDTLRYRMDKHGLGD